MLMNDIWFKQNSSIFSPFCEELIRKIEKPVFSFGLGSYGYDLRLSSKEFRVMTTGAQTNPKCVDSSMFEFAQPRVDEYGTYFLLPPLSLGLGVSLERIQMPQGFTGICYGKSSYARCGIIANVTPIESGWCGHLTISLFNGSPRYCRVYTEEGIVQVLVLAGEDCEITYQDRQGKYQNQPESVVFSKV